MAKIYPKFGGLLLNDASWDAENVIVGVSYSKYLASILRPGRIPGQKDPVVEKPKTGGGGNNNNDNNNNNKGGGNVKPIDSGSVDEPDEPSRPRGPSGPILIFNGKFK